MKAIRLQAAVPMSQKGKIHKKPKVSEDGSKPIKGFPIIEPKKAVKKAPSKKK